MRQGPSDVIQGDPVLKREGDSVGSGKNCIYSNPPPPAANKLRKENHHTLSSSSNQLRIAHNKQAPQLSRRRPNSFQNTITFFSPSRQKIRASTSKLKKAPNVMTEPQSSKTRRLSEPKEARVRISKLQKRSGHDVLQRKAQKKRKKEHLKEIKVKEIALYSPKRPAVTFIVEDNPTRLRKRKRRNTWIEVKHPPTDHLLDSFNLNSSPRSSLSNQPDMKTAYVLSTLDALSARPTIKIAPKPRYTPPHGYSYDYSNELDRRQKSTIVSQNDIGANERVDCIADRLSAHELRELMERDQKRKEKKRMAKLVGKGKIQNRHSGIETTKRISSIHNSQIESCGEISIRRPDSTHDVTKPSEDKEKDILIHFRERKEEITSNTHDIESSPNKSSHRNTHTRNIYPPKFTSNQTRENVKLDEPKSASKKPKRSNFSQYLSLRLSSSSAASDQVTNKSNKFISEPPSTWAIFKLRNKNKRESVSPSYSTTSRDSLPSGHPPHLSHTPMRSTSSIPKRTVSRFREDLPEFLVSSQTAKMVSHESQEPQDLTSKPRPNELTVEAVKIHDHTLINVQDSLITGNKSNQTLSSNHKSNNEISPDPNTLSQSLASIDSEASWLSGGKRLIRNSSQMAQQRQRTNSISSSMNNQENLKPPTQDKLIKQNEDDYFSYRSTFDDDHNPQSSMAWDEEISSVHTKWGAVARQPQIIHNNSIALKSRHGLLTEVETVVEGKLDSISTEPSALITMQEPPIEKVCENGNSRPRGTVSSILGRKTRKILTTLKLEK